MKKILDYLIQLGLDFREWTGGVFNHYLPLIYIISILISVILVWITVYAMLRSGWIRYKYNLWSDILGVGDIGKRRQLRAWKKIIKRLQSEDANEWKMVILESDAIFDEILKASGYRGENVHERFKQLPKESLSVHDRIMTAHEVRDKILLEPEFVITREQAVSMARVYQQAFRELGLID